ncbi:hypothetical protein Ancab_006254 [Ancistrocladus abbreviatus]
MHMLSINKAKGWQKVGNRFWGWKGREAGNCNSICPFSSRPRQYNCNRNRVAPNDGSSLWRVKREGSSHYGAWYKGLRLQVIDYQTARHWRTVTSTLVVVPVHHCPENKSVHFLPLPVS